MKRITLVAILLLILIGLLPFACAESDLDAYDAFSWQDDNEYVYGMLPGGATVKVPKDIYLEDGINIAISGLQETEDFTVGLLGFRNYEANHYYPDGVYRCRYEIRLTRRDGRLELECSDRKIEFLHSFNQGYTKDSNNALTVYHPETYTDERGDLYIHMDLPDMYGYSFDYSRYDLIAEDIDPLTETAVTIHHYREGYSRTTAENMLGGWRFVSASDGKQYDDMYIEKQQITFRRRDSNGEVYYASRAIDTIDDYSIDGLSYSYYVLDYKGALVFKDKNGIKMMYEKTDETIDDYSMQFMQAATPDWVRMLNHKWFRYDSDFGMDLNNYLMFYEDALYSYQYGRSKASSISAVRYEDNKILYLDADGNVKEQREYLIEYGYELTLYWLENGQRVRGKAVYEIARGDRLLAAPPTSTPMATPTPSPLPVNADLFRQLGDYDYTKNSMNLPNRRISSGTKDRVDDAYSMSKELTKEVNQVIHVSFNGKNALANISNTMDVPVRFRIYVLGTYKEKHARFYNSSRQQLADLTLPGGNKSVFEICTGALQPGERVYFRIMEDGKKSDTVILMISQDIFDSSVMKDAYTVSEAGQTDVNVKAYIPTATPSPTPKPTATPSPTPSPIPVPTVVITPVPEPTATLPPALPETPTIEDGGLFAEERVEAVDATVTFEGYSDNTGIVFELSSDGTALVTEILPEGEEETDASWSLDGNKLLVTGEGRYGKQYNLEFENGSAEYILDGTPLLIELSSDYEAISLFFGEGMVPSGMDLTSIPTSALTPEPTEVPTPVPTIEPTEVPTPVPTAVPTPVPTPEPTAIPTIVPTPISLADLYLVPISDKPGCYKVTVNGVNATSWITAKYPDDWTPGQMIDGNANTSFQFSSKTTRLGKAYMYFTFAYPANMDEMWIMNGFWKNFDGLDRYNRNCRIKKMTLDFRYEGSNSYSDALTVTLPDDQVRTDWTVVNLGEKKNVTEVRILIQEVYTGSVYKNDVCVTEVMFVKKKN